MTSRLIGTPGTMCLTKLTFVLSGFFFFMWVRIKNLVGVKTTHLQFPNLNELRTRKREIPQERTYIYMKIEYFYQSSRIYFNLVKRNLFMCASWNKNAFYWFTRDWRLKINRIDFFSSRKNTLVVIFNHTFLIKIDDGSGFFFCLDLIVEANNQYRLGKANLDQCLFEYDFNPFYNRKGQQKCWLCLENFSIFFHEDFLSSVKFSSSKFHITCHITFLNKNFYIIIIVNSSLLKIKLFI